MVSLLWMIPPTTFRFSALFSVNFFMESVEMLVLLQFTLTSLGHLNTTKKNQ